jgi:hypothetical protein
MVKVHLVTVHGWLYRGALPRRKQLIKIKRVFKVDFSKCKDFAAYDVIKFGKKLKSWKLKEGYTNYDLEALTGIAYTTIGNWANGVRKPDIKYLEKFDECCGTGFVKYLNRYCVIKPAKRAGP